MKRPLSDGAELKRSAADGLFTELSTLITENARQHKAAISESADRRPKRGQMGWQSFPAIPKKILLFLPRRRFLEYNRKIEN
jgi:hypothetical protein